MAGSMAAFRWVFILETFMVHTRRLVNTIINLIMKSSTIWSSFCFAWISLSVLSSQAQTLDQTIALGDQMYESGLYEQSIPYYERALFFAGSKVLPEVTYRLAESFLASGQYEQALIYYDESYHLNKNPERKAEILFSRASAYLQSGNPGFALIELMSIQSEGDTLIELRKQYYLGAVKMRMDQYASAEKHFSDYLVLAGFPEKVSELKSLMADTVRFTRINPRLAGYLSLIIPGSGQLYAGAWKEALNSFLLVGGLQAGFLYISINYSLLDAYLGIFPWWQRYYSGGYKAAKRLATEKKNRLRDQVYLQILKQTYLSDLTVGKIN